MLRFELRVLEQLLGLNRGEEPASGPAPEARVRPEPDVPSRPAGPEAAPPRRPTPVRPATPPRPAIVVEPEPPAHIDTEPELVGEFSEAGAEEGAGPEIHVDEPWSGYRRTPVAAIKDRIAVAAPAELAVIQLYETTHRRRGSILNAVERRSKQLAHAPAAR